MCRAVAVVKARIQRVRSGHIVTLQFLPRDSTVRCAHQCDQGLSPMGDHRIRDKSARALRAGSMRDLHYHAQSRRVTHCEDTACP